MRKKYYKTGTVILGIFIAAVIAVIVTVILIHQSGLRYIKSDAGVKYFGNVDDDENIINGRLWFKSDAAAIGLQKFYIIEAKDTQSASYLPDKNTITVDLLSSQDNADVLSIINTYLPAEIKNGYPLYNFVFNNSESGIFYKNDTFDELIKKYEDEKNIIQSGEIYTSDGGKWILILSGSGKHTSYNNFEIVREDNREKKYKGDVLDIIRKEDIDFASFTLSGGAVINLYSTYYDVYRISYDKGTRSGELYIGLINGGFQKNGKGLYYHGKNSDIYYGNFINDEKTGKAEILSAFGDSYAGDIENGLKTGEGIFSWNDGSYYKGIFKDNMKNGAGTHVFADGSVYEGDFVNDVKNGKGKYTWSSGDIYEGDYENDLYKGKGRYTWANGDYYEGDFDHNAPHGWGIYYWISGRKYEGWFSEGKLVLEKPEDITGGESPAPLDPEASAG